MPAAVVGGWVGHMTEYETENLRMAIMAVIAVALIAVSLWSLI